MNKQKQINFIASQAVNLLPKQKKSLKKNGNKVVVLKNMTQHQAISYLNSLPEPLFQEIWNKYQEKRRKKMVLETYASRTYKRVAHKAGIII